MTMSSELKRIKENSKYLNKIKRPPQDSAALAVLDDVICRIVFDAAD